MGKLVHKNERLLFVIVFITSIFAWGWILYATNSWADPDAAAATTESLLPPSSVSITKTPSVSEIFSLQAAASKGDAEAQFQIGFINESQNNLAEAKSWYQKAAEQGHIAAEVRLGGFYWSGQGVSKSITEAKKWFRKSLVALKPAVKRGDAEAEYLLGSLYDKGWGVKQDFKTAMDLYLKAAAQGHVVAQNALGVHYEQGDGVKKDLTEAKKWYQAAANQGDPAGITHLQRLQNTAIAQ